MKKKIALFHHIDYDFDAVYDEKAENSESFVRVSEYIEVDFTMLPGDPIAESKAKTKKERIEKLRLQINEIENS